MRNGLEVYRRNEVVKTAGAELPEFVTEEEVKRMIYEAGKENSERDKLLLETMWATGMRVSEITTIRPIDVQEVGISVFGKRMPRTENEMKEGAIPHEKRMRIIPIPAPLRQKLISYIFRQRIGDEKKIFPITTTRVYQLVALYANKANIQRKIHPHMFRHGFAVYFLRRTHSINALQQILGHTNLQSTTVYTKLDPIELQQYVDMAFGDR